MFHANTNDINDVPDLNNQALGWFVALAALEIVSIHVKYAILVEVYGIKFKIKYFSNY